MLSGDYFALITRPIVSVPPGNLLKLQKFSGFFPDLLNQKSVLFWWFRYILVVGNHCCME